MVRTPIIKTMRNNLKNCWCLMGIGLFCCWSALDRSALRISPVRAESERSLSQQNFPSDNFNPTFDNQLNPYKSRSLAQLPGGPTLKTKRLKEAPPDELTPPSAPRIPSDLPAPFKPVKNSSLIIDARAYESNRAGLEKAIATVDQAGGVLHFSPGTWDIDADLTIPAAVTVRLDRGALLRVGTQKSSGTLSHSGEECEGNISVADGATQVTGSGTEFSKLRPGQFINCEGQSREIKGIAGNTQLEVFTPFHPAITGKAFSKSSYIIKGSGTKFDTELEVGDFLYHGKEKHIITSISGPDALTVAEYPSHSFSGEAYTRSVRVKILGSLEAGLYQAFSGKGVVKFAPGALISVHPEWWGAKGNGEKTMAGANSLAIEKALHSVMDYRKAAVSFTNGTYFINRPIVILTSNSLIGQGRGNTHIALAPHSNCHMVKDCLPIRGIGAGVIRDIFFNNGVQDAGYDGIHFFNNYKFYVIENSGFVSYTKHPDGYAIYLNVSGSTLVRDNFIYGFYNGIYAFGFDSFYVNNEIAPGGDYAIFLIGDGNVVQGNIMYGDSGCKTGILSWATSTSIIGNRIGPFDHGIKIYTNGGIISGNVIVANRQYGIYSFRHAFNAHITDNKFFYNAGYGLYFQGACVNSLIKNNTFTHNNGGAHNPQMRIDVQVPPNQGFDEPLAEDNVGVDLQCAFPTLGQNSTPDIRMAKRWKTANTKPLTITDFLGGCRGKEILMVFGDAQTTLKFSGPSKLNGHGGVDWRPAVGDHLRAMKGDDGYWYCECYDNHSKTNR
ncbi:MAG: right-handed parallel beta-helix repeat-containing protein [Desulfobaccales bacterium]